MNITNAFKKKPRTSAPIICNNILTSRIHFHSSRSKDINLINSYWNSCLFSMKQFQINRIINIHFANGDRYGLKTSIQKPFAFNTLAFTWIGWADSSMAKISSHWFASETCSSSFSSRALKVRNLRAHFGKWKMKM